MLNNQAIKMSLW